MNSEPFLIPFGDLEEQARIRRLCSRLPRQSGIRKAAEELLGGTVPDPYLVSECVAALSRQSAPRWRERSVAAWVLGVVPLSGPMRDQAAEALARVVDNFDLHRDASGRLLRAAGRTAAALTLLVAVGLLGGELLPALGMEDFLLMAALAVLSIGGIPPVSFFWDHRCTNMVRVEAARALGRMVAPHYLGALARGVTDPNQAVRYASIVAMNATLPALRPGIEATLPRDVGVKLCGVLKAAHGCALPKLAAAILRALAVVGTAEVIPTVEYVADRARNDSVRAAAKEALPTLYARRERDRQSEVLLRPSAPQEDVRTTLLRPVVSTGTSEPELLLRPTSGEETP